MKTYFSTILIVIFTACTSNESVLPVLSYQIDGQGNKVVYTITYDAFVNQFGESFTTKTIDGKVVIANFFFTRCPSICPPIRNSLIDFASDFKNNNDFLIVSHTIDPKNDSIPVLYDYWETTDIPALNWQFLYAPETKVKKQAAQYMTVFKKNEDDTDFYHSSYISLLDKKQQIRGFYNSLIEEDMERLKKDVNYLLNLD